MKLFSNAVPPYSTSKTKWKINCSARWLAGISNRTAYTLSFQTLQSSTLSKFIHWALLPLRYQSRRNPISSHWTRRISSASLITTNINYGTTMWTQGDATSWATALGNNTAPEAEWIAQHCSAINSKTIPSCRWWMSPNSVWFTLPILLSNVKLIFLIGEWWGRSGGFQNPELDPTSGGWEYTQSH